MIFKRILNLDAKRAYVRTSDSEVYLNKVKVVVLVNPGPLPVTKLLGLNKAAQLFLKMCKRKPTLAK